MKSTNNALKNPNFKLIFVLLLALTLRLAGIASRPIWYDESFSILLSEKGPAAILNGTLSTDADSSAAEEHPPAYYFMLWGWMQMLGNSIISARAFSILASLGIILLVYKIGEHLFDPLTAFVSAAICAILPFQIHYGQEIRMYVFMALWLSLATYALLKRKWVLFSVAAALAQYTHNLSAIFLVTLALTPLLQRDWKTLRAVTLAGFGALILYIPWLAQLPAQLAKVSTHFWIAKPGIEKLFTLFLIYLPNLPLPGNLLLPALLFSTLIIVLAAFQTYRAKNANGGWLAYLSFVPPLLLWLISQVTPIYIERALLPSHVMFSLWLGWSLTRAKMPRPILELAALLIVLSAGMGIYEHITYRGFPYIETAQINASLQSRLQAGDIILHSSKLSYLPAFYAAPDAAQQIYITDPRGSGTDTLSPATQKVLGLRSAENIQSATHSAKRIWFIIYQYSIDEYTSNGFATHPHLDYLNQHFTLKSTETFENIQIYLYEKKSQE